MRQPRTVAGFAPLDDMRVRTRRDTIYMQGCVLTQSATPRAGVRAGARRGDARTGLYVAPLILLWRRLLILLLP